MNKVAKIFSYIAFVFAFCFMAIGYAAVQDTLTVSGSVSIEVPIKPFAVYGTVYASNGADMGKALNFYNRPIVQAGDEIPLGEGKQEVTEVYTNIATLALTKAEKQPWFKHQTDINSIDVIDEGIQPTNMAYWFSGLGSCTSFNLEKLDTSEVTNMRYMFYGCSAVQTLDLSRFNTSKVTKMLYMFDGCSALQELDLRGFDTSKVTEMGYMFKDCTSLTHLDLSSFDTSGLKDEGIGEECLYGMFYKCSNLVTLDISSFNTGSVFSIEYMFSYCGNLMTIYAGNGFDVDDKQFMRDDSAFVGCTKLVGGKGTTFNPSKYTASYARIDGLDGQKGYFTCKHTYDENNPCTICGVIVVTTPAGLTDEEILGKDYTVEGGTYGGENIISANGVNVTANNAILTIENANAVSVSNGGTLILNDVTVGSNPNPTALARVEGGTLIIKSGTYAVASIAMSDSSGIVKIYGGDFTISGFNGTSGSGNSTITIYGGTFNIEPTSPYLAPGYVAQDNGNGTWTVVAE